MIRADDIRSTIEKAVNFGSRILFWGSNVLHAFVLRQLQKEIDTGEPSKLLPSTFEKKLISDSLTSVTILGGCTWNSKCSASKEMQDALSSVVDDMLVGGGFKKIERDRMTQVISELSETYETSCQVHLRSQPVRLVARILCVSLRDEHRKRVFGLPFRFKIASSTMAHFFFERLLESKGAQTPEDWEALVNATVQRQLDYFQRNPNEFSVDAVEDARRRLTSVLEIFRIITKTPWVLWYSTAVASLAARKHERREAEKAEKREFESHWKAIIRSAATKDEKKTHEAQYREEKATWNKSRSEKRKAATEIEKQEKQRLRENGELVDGLRDIDLLRISFRLIRVMEERNIAEAEEKDAAEDSESVSTVNHCAPRTSSLLPLKQFGPQFIRLSASTVDSIVPKRLHDPESETWYGKVFTRVPRSITRDGKRNLSSIMTDGVQVRFCLERTPDHLFPAGEQEACLLFPKDVWKLTSEKRLPVERPDNLLDLVNVQRGIFDLESLRDPSGSIENCSVIGVDPGRKDIATWSASDKGNHPAPKDFRDLGSGTKRVSSTLHKRDTLISRWNRVDLALRKATGVEAVFEELAKQSRKTASESDIAQYCRVVLENQSSLEKYYYHGGKEMKKKDRKVFSRSLGIRRSVDDRMIRKWRFRRFSARQTFLDTFALKLLGKQTKATRKADQKPCSDETPLWPLDSGTRSDPNQKRVVAFGNAKFSVASPGHFPCPRKALIKRLSYQSVVVMVDEFKTSQVCCLCHRKMLDEPGTRSRVKKCTTCLAHFETGGTPTSQCVYWDRDTNASLNIYWLAVSHFRGLQRPEGLCRGS